jgi:hypothetical protein
MGYSPFPILEERWLPHLGGVRSQDEHDLQRVRGAIAWLRGRTSIDAMAYVCVQVMTRQPLLRGSHNLTRSPRSRSSTRRRRHWRRSRRSGSERPRRFPSRRTRTGLRGARPSAAPGMGMAHPGHRDAGARRGTPAAETRAQDVAPRLPTGLTVEVVVRSPVAADLPDPCAQQRPLGIVLRHVARGSLEKLQILVVGPIGKL